MIGIFELGIYILNECNFYIIGYDKAIDHIYLRIFLIGFIK